MPSCFLGGTNCNTWASTPRAFAGSLISINVISKCHGCPSETSCQLALHFVLLNVMIGLMTRLPAIGKSNDLAWRMDGVLACSAVLEGLQTAIEGRNALNRHCCSWPIKLGSQYKQEGNKDSSS